MIILLKIALAKKLQNSRPSPRKSIAYVSVNSIPRNRVTKKSPDYQRIVKVIVQCMHKNFFLSKALKLKPEPGLGRPMGFRLAQSRG